MSVFLAVAVAVAVAVATVADALAEPGEVGIVETAAGPGFCSGTATVAEASRTVRSIAVGGDGRLYVDTGPIGRAVVAKVDPEGEAHLVPTPAAAVPRRNAGVLSPSNRLAPDGKGGVFIAAGTALLQLHESGGSGVVAGQLRESRGEGGDGDGGPALQARFAAIAAVASDEAGNAYVTDRAGSGSTAVRVRFVNRASTPVTFYPGTPHELTVAPGAIDTIAGASASRSAGPADVARSTVLQGSFPAMAALGQRLYVATYQSSGARPSAGVSLINLGGQTAAVHGVAVPPGGITTVAGGTAAGFAGDGGPARAGAFSLLRGIAADAEGNLFLADEANHRIRRVDAAGVITTFAGTGRVGRAGGGFNGNEVAASQALLNRPFDVEVGPQGRVYIADQLNGQVRLVGPDGVIRAAPGNGVGLSWRCDEDGRRRPASGQLSTPAPGRPWAVAAQRNGVVYVSLPDLGRVKKVGPTRATDVALMGDETAPTRGPFEHPGAVEPASDGGLYVLEGQGRVRYVNETSTPLNVNGRRVPPRAIVTVLEGPSTPQVLGPGALAADGDGDVFVADFSTVRYLDRSGKVTTIVSLNPQGCCLQPAGLALDPAGNLYVADGGPTARVWLLNRSATEVVAHGQRIPPGGMRPVAGSGVFSRGFGGDGGPALEARFGLLRGLALDDSGSLYGVDATENTVRRIDATGIITTVAGTGIEGFNGDRRKGALTALRAPMDVAIDHCGNVLIADSGNDRVRRVTLSSTCPVAGSSSSSPAASKDSSRVAPWPVVTIGLLAAASSIVVLLKRRWKRLGERDEEDGKSWRESRSDSCDAW